MGKLWIVIAMSVMAACAPKRAQTTVVRPAVASTDAQPLEDATPFHTARESVAATTDSTLFAQQPQPQPQPQPMPMQPTSAEPSTARPEGMAFALGVGYQLSTSLETPNVTSMRLRLSSGFTIEPIFAIANESVTTETMNVEANDKHTLFSVAALGRLPLISRGKADFEGLARLGFSNDKDNPDGDFNTTTINRFAVGWGMAVGWWFSPHWNLSMSVTNDLIAYSSTKKQTGPGVSTTSTTTDIGLIFSPQVLLMLHLYN